MLSWQLAATESSYLHGGPDELEFSFDRRDAADDVSLAFENRSRERGGDEFLRVAR